MIESQSHVGIYHYFRGFFIEVADFADVMNMEICQAQCYQAKCFQAQCAVYQCYS